MGKVDKWVEKQACPACGMLVVLDFLNILPKYNNRDI